MLERSLIALTLVLLMGSVQARMYQWVSPTTGRVQLSGTPPGWYRSQAGGPRVRVFDNGNLVDDTAIQIPAAQRTQLREAAFRELEQRRRADALKRLERLARQEQARQTRLAEAQAEQQLALERARRDREAEASQRRRAPPLPSADSREPLDDAMIERLRALVGEFDRGGGAAANR